MKAIINQKWLIVSVVLLITSATYAQFVVSDPLHTAVSQLMKLLQDPSFKTLVKNVEKLKKVSNGVQQFHRGTQLISSITQTTSLLQQMASTINKDGHIYAAEYQLIAQDFKNIAKAGTDIMKDMRQSTSQNLLEMNDAERMNWLNTAYERANKFQSLVRGYYTRIRAMSMRRAGNLRDREATAKLYDIALQNLGKVGSYDSDLGIGMAGLKGYDDSYDNGNASVLDNYDKTEDATKMRQAQEDFNRRLMNYQDELQIAELYAEKTALSIKITEGYTPVKSWSESNASWKTPDGKEISQQEFNLVIKMLTRELLIPAREILVKKYRIDEGIKLN